MAALLRKALPEDLPALTRRLGVLPLFTRYGLSPPLLRARWEQALLLGEQLWVAVEQGEPLGVSWHLPNGAFASGAYLRTLAVAAEAQGRGLGAQLLAHYEAACGRPAGGYFLLTSDFNTAAQRFYRAHGYQEVGRLPGFAVQEVTELIFWKRASGGR